MALYLPLLMNSEDIARAVEQRLLHRQMSPSERFVLVKSIEDQDYRVMAKGTSYAQSYLKVVGSRLWQELSGILGQKVTKKNIHLILQQRLQDWEGQEQQRSPLNSRSQPPPFNLNHEPNQKCLEGPVPLNSRFYVERPPLEQRAYGEIAQPGSLIRIKAPRHQGKSSLLLRIGDHAKSLGLVTVLLDFRETDTTAIHCLDQLLRWLCVNIAQQLDLPANLDQYWHADLGSKVSCRRFFQEYLLQEIPTPMVLILNAVDRVFEHPAVAEDFLPMLRFWHDQAQKQNSWREKLRLVMAYSTEIYVPLHLNHSPFNVGVVLELPPFQIDQVLDLAQRYSLDWLDEQEPLQIMEMLGGHPYLLNIAFNTLKTTEVPLSQLLETAPTPTGIFKDHLQRYWALVCKDPQLTSALQAIANTSVQGAKLDPIAAYKLSSLGLVTLEGYRAWFSCDLYRQYFGNFLDSTAPEAQ